MHGSFRVLLQVLWAQLLCGWVLGSELTFELPDNAKQCFYEDIIIGTKCTLEFQVRRSSFGPKLRLINRPYGEKELSRVWTGDIRLQRLTPQG